MLAVVPLLLATLPALAAARRASASNSNIATLHSLDAYVAPFGARSLDGSPYEIWVAQAPAASPNKNKWVIDIMGGA